MKTTNYQNLDNLIKSVKRNTENAIRLDYSAILDIIDLGERSEEEALLSIDKALAYWDSIHYGECSEYLYDYPFVFIDALDKIVRDSTKTLRSTKGKDKAVVDMLIICAARENYFVNVTGSAAELYDKVDQIKEKYGVTFNDTWLRHVVLRHFGPDINIDTLGNPAIDHDVQQKMLVANLDHTDVGFGVSNSVVGLAN